MRADPATQAGVLIPPGDILGIQDDGVGGAPLHTGATAVAGFFIDYRKVVGGIDHRQGAVTPELQCIIAILATVADAGFGAAFPGPTRFSLKEFMLDSSGTG